MYQVSVDQMGIGWGGGHFCKVLVGGTCIQAIYTFPTSLEISFWYLWLGFTINYCPSVAVAFGSLYCSLSASLSFVLLTPPFGKAQLFFVVLTFHST